MFVEGVREKARVEFDTWLHQDTDSERVCCVTGPLGSGKTTLAAEFCGVEPGEGTRDVKKQRREGEEGARLITAFHFFQGGGTLALNKCWVEIGRQLAGQLGYDIRGDVSTEEDGLFVFRRLVAEPLTRLSKPSNKIVVLVDGVDNLPWATRESFWEIVSQTWERETPMWVHLAVFSYTTLRLSGAIRWIDLQDEDHEKDIELLCNARLASFMQDEEDVQYATKHIVRHSTERPSVLLYTSCVLDALLEDRSHQSVTLDDIWEMEWRPECLVHAFRPYLIRFLDHVMDGDMDRYQQLLSCLSAARTPLSIDVAAEALEMDNESFTTLLSRSTSLVYQEGDAIMFAHPCLKNVVQQRRCGMYPDGIPLHVNERRGHEWLATFLQNSPTSPLALRDMFYHLCLSRKWSVVQDYVLDFDWVLACVSEKGCALALIEDADKLYNDKPYSNIHVTDVVRTIDLGLEAILLDSALLKQQILLRIPDETHPIRRSYEASLFLQTNRAKRVFLPVTKLPLPVLPTFRKLLRVTGEASTRLNINAGQALGSLEFFDCRYVQLSKCIMWDSVTNKMHILERSAKRIQGSRAHSYEEVEGIVEVWDWRFQKTLFRQVITNTYDDVIAHGNAFLAVNRSLRCEYGSERQYESPYVDEEYLFELLLFDLKSGSCLHQIKHRMELCDIKVQDNIVVLAGSQDFCGDEVRYSLMIWDIETGACLRTIPTPPMPRGTLSLSGDSIYMACGEHNLWNWRTGVEETSLPTEAYNVDLTAGIFFLPGGEVRDVEMRSSLGFCAPSTRCWIGFDRQTVLSPIAPLSDDIAMYGLCTEPLPLLDVRLFRFSSVGYLDDDVVLSYVEMRPAIQMWKTKTGELLRTFVYDPDTSTSDEILSVCLDHRFVVCETQSYIRVWDRTEDPSCSTVIRKPQGKLFRVHLYDDCIAVWSGRNGVWEYDPTTGECLGNYENLSQETYSVQFLPDHFLLGVEEVLNETQYLIAYRTGIREFVWRVNTEIWHPVCPNLIYYCDATTLFVRDWRTWELIRTVHLTPSPCRSPLICISSHPCRTGSKCGGTVEFFSRRKVGDFITLLNEAQEWIFIAPIFGTSVGRIQILSNNDCTVVAFGNDVGNIHIYVNDLS